MHFRQSLSGLENFSFGEHLEKTMEQTIPVKPSKLKIRMTRLLTYFGKPQNAILLVLGIVLSITTIAPIVSILLEEA